MTKRLFTEKEQAQLKCNPHVQAVSDKVISTQLNLNSNLLLKMSKEKYQKLFLKKQV
ncbi:hypothetical protein ACQKKK_25150 [Peribacillus sp. NPDC006672]|uniref:hypothetical protein n=1 Tax=Peribacillus sp. NPDC006672 TaxID=3390606 RepID=UPI003D03FCCA